MVSVWSATQHLVLGQKKVGEKSNEITAIPPLLEMLAIRGCLVSIAPMGCQTEIYFKRLQFESYRRTGT